MATTQDIVQKLWNLCNVLRDDGITYHQYVTELTYLLFLKMVKETDKETQIPEGYRWDDLKEKDGVEQLDFYRIMLVHLGSEGSDRVQAIFANATTTLRQPKNVQKLVQSINDIDWYSAREERIKLTTFSICQRPNRTFRGRRHSVASNWSQIPTNLPS